MPFLRDCYIWGGWVGLDKNRDKPQNCALRIHLVVNRIKTVGPEKLYSHLENRCGKQKKRWGLRNCAVTRKT